MRGVVVSCPRYGQVWGTDAFSESLKEIQALGANWVQIHPYASVDQSGQIKYSAERQLKYLTPAVERAKRAGSKMFWKPHLAYWGSFKWRGDIAFDSEEKWARFFADYRKWMTDHARFAEHHKLPVLVVGTELEKTVHRKEWPAIIDEIRGIYKGKITWAANWDGVPKIGFWDKLDYVGVQAYFPIGVATSSDEQMRATLKGHLAAIKKTPGAKGKKIIFTEVGYARSMSAADKPWEPKNDDSAAAIALRTRLMTVVLEEIESNTDIAGAFWWKWMPGWTPWDRDFSMKNPEARSTLKKHWAKKHKAR